MSEPRRLVHFTPLRYPGGKAKLSEYVKEIIRANKLYDGEYVEPYTAREMRTGKEVMFFSPKIAVPDLVGPIQQVGRMKVAA